MANLAFSVCAAVASLVVTLLAASRGVWAVALVFGALTVGFLARASERYWRDQR
jgi:uncharacterized membrane protein YjjB (DUF3815 family)